MINLLPVSYLLHNPSSDKPQFRGSIVHVVSGFHIGEQDFIKSKQYFTAKAKIILLYVLALCNYYLIKAH